MPEKFNQEDRKRMQERSPHLYAGLISRTIVTTSETMRIEQPGNPTTNKTEVT
jgi:hypothetical protein